MRLSIFSVIFISDIRKGTCVSDGRATHPDRQDTNFSVTIENAIEIWESKDSTVDLWLILLHIWNVELCVAYLDTGCAWS